MLRQPRARSGRIAAATAAVLILLATVSVASSPAAASTGTFHRYSGAREFSVGHYSGARFQVTLRRYTYEQGRTGCVYNPLWLFFRGGWIEIGLAHHCGSSGLQIYGYVSCDGHRRFVERTPVPADSTRRTLAIARIPHGYALRVNGHTHARVGVRSSCRSPTGMTVGLESYSPAVVIHHQLDRALAYRRGTRWYPWQGRDASGSSPGLSGHWAGARTWVFSENA